MDNTENISHVILSQRVHWGADCCLATSYNIRPLRHMFHFCTFELFTEPLPRNALSKFVTVLTINEALVRKYYDLFCC
jgi:hypothetical protein